MNDKPDRKTEPPLHVPMTWGEMLSRTIETKPHEVEPPPGRKRKEPKAAVPAKRKRAPKDG